MLHRWRSITITFLLSAAGASALHADPPLFLVDSPFETETGFQPTRIYTVDPTTGSMTLKADLGSNYSPCLGLAAASADHLYAVCTDHDPVEIDGDDTCFNCVLLEVVLDPLSTVPASMTKIGRIREGGATIDQISQLTFRNDGALYAVSERTGLETLYRVDLGDAGAAVVGNVTIDCTTGLDVQGGDLTFDSLDRLWLWTNNPSAPQTGKGLWEVNPANACATQSAACPGGHNLAGLAVIGHLDVDTHLRAVSSTAHPDMLFTLTPGACPSDPVGLSLDGSPFDMSRGDLDSPFCESDAMCADGDPCTVDVCSPGGCRHDAAAPNGTPCDDGNACTTGDACQGGVCQPGSPVVCAAIDSCHDAGLCDPVTGACSNPATANGTPCDDGNACTTGDACQGGACQPGSSVVCAAIDSCHDAGLCDPGTGACSNPAKADSTPCDDGNATTCTDLCLAGVCQGTPVPAPPEVDASVMLGKNTGNAVISWSALPGIYNVYRGSRPAATGWSYNQTCLQSALPGSPATDGGDPAPGSYFYYLVSRVDLCRESVIGRNSAGVPDPNSSPCVTP